MKARPKLGDGFSAPVHELGAQPAHLLVPGRERIARRKALRHTPQRRVALADGRAVLRGEPRAGRRETTEHAVEVGPPRGRATLDDNQPVRREDECRHFAAQLLGRAEAGPVEARTLARAELERHLQLDGRTCPLAPEGDPRRITPEAHQLRVCPRPRREPLRPDVQRLEQIRLAGPVRPRYENQSARKVQVELGIRAEIPERNRAYDQPV